VGWKILWSYRYRSSNEVDRALIITGLQLYQSEQMECFGMIRISGKDVLALRLGLSDISRLQQLYRRGKRSPDVQVHGKLYFMGAIGNHR
jgi:hypothetical protein